MKHPWEAFVWLRTSFTTAPILCHPEPNLPFIVEVDASSSGIGAVLSQQRGTPEKLHPCAFYSRKLTMAKANYDVGNRELLSIKATLEEWRHWLEGARRPFLVLTDHLSIDFLTDLPSSGGFTSVMVVIDRFSKACTVNSCP
ncbi:hypothetical protein QTP86_002591 [Hemibagrus guttatus]|nr:hypothetical protein QTP86_002591 [Hemibagrus guttatus]